MGRKHKHEEHINHERWVISYADMVTLLFALFVVLYSLGEVKLSKLKKLKQSLAFAFHFEGHGRTNTDGLYEFGDVGGKIVDGAILLNPQKGPMREFLMQTLPREFEEVTGLSLDIELTNDTIRFSGPLSGFFEPGKKTLRPKVHKWLTELVENAHTVAENIRIHIRAPRLMLGRYEDTGEPYYARTLCLERLGYLHQMVGLMNQVMEYQVKIEFNSDPKPAQDPAHWEDEAVISFFFTNTGPR